MDDICEDCGGTCDENFTVRLQINDYGMEATAHSEIGVAALLSMLVTKILCEWLDEAFEEPVDPELN